MTILVAGATGATGRLLTRRLLADGHDVTAIVRSADRLPDDVRHHERLRVHEASLLDLDDDAIADLVRGCGAVASCLGHTLSFRGVFGPPYRLVTEAVRRLCRAIAAGRPATPVRFVLMNTAGNRDLAEPVSFGQRAVVGLLRVLVPPQADNEQAAEHLRRVVGPDHGMIEWVAVRPDTLHDAEEASAYDVHPSPTRSAIFDPGKTSRINVAHFMARLVDDDATWAQWRGRMPVIYDRAAP